MYNGLEMTGVLEGGYLSALLVITSLILGIQIWNFETMWVFIVVTFVMSCQWFTVYIVDSYNAFCVYLTGVLKEA